MYIIDILRIIISIRTFNRLHFEHRQNSRIISITARQTYIFGLFVFTADLCTDRKTVCNLCINIQLKVSTFIFEVTHHGILSGMGYRKVVIGPFRTTRHVSVNVVLWHIFSHHHIIIVITLISRFRTSFPFRQFFGAI